MRFPDFWLLIPALLLSLLGLALVYSIAPSNFSSQLVFIVIGICLFWLISWLDMNIIRAFSPIIFGLALALLLITVGFGRIIRGSSRWLELGSFRFQTSEFMKPALMLGLSYLSSWLNPRNFGHFLLGLILIAVPAGLVFIQPDLGSTVMLLVIGGYGLLALGTKKRFLILLIIGMAAAMPLLWYSLADYQKGRIQTFLNPQEDPLGSSYNQIQAVIAAGSGQWIGKGLGKGTQSHLKFLPERHTDFMFASLAEELGFLGSSLVIVLYFFLEARLIWLAKSTTQPHLRVIFLGTFTLFLIQSTVHIGINLGILPVKGLTLPLLSVGGSSLLASWISLGLASSASQEVKGNRAVFLRY